MPLPDKPVALDHITNTEELDDVARKSFSLAAADWQLISDFRQHTLPDALRKTPGAGRKITQRTAEDAKLEPGYCDTVLRVIKGTFGPGKAVSMTIYSESGKEKLPVRMVTVRLNRAAQEPIAIEMIDADGLFGELKKFYDEQLSRKVRLSSTGGGLGFQRVAYLVRSDNKGGVSLTLIKPDERRYWLRSLAMRDADQIASLLFCAAAKKR